MSPSRISTFWRSAVRSRGDVGGVEVDPDDVLRHGRDPADILTLPAPRIEHPLAHEVVDGAGLDPHPPVVLFGLVEVLPLVLPLVLLRLGLHGAHYGSRVASATERWPTGKGPGVSRSLLAPCRSVSSSPRTTIWCARRSPGSSTPTTTSRWSARAETSTGCSPVVAEHSPTSSLTDIRMPPTGTDEGVRAANELRQHAPRHRRRGAEPVRRARYALELLDDGSGGGPTC